MDRTTEYAKLVVNKKKIAGRKEYLACERHLQDLKRKNFDYKFNKELAEKAINIINELVIGEGEEQQKLSTRGFQNFIIGSLFGWVKKKTKERRFREAYIQVGRQNGKSILSGAMANQFATFSGYKLGRIFCAATKQEQANIVWDEIAKFIRSDNDLQEMYKITEHERTIKSFVTGNVIKSLGRDTKSADGFRSILAICDELHAHSNNQMYKLMLDGQINVDGALTLAITTAGFNLNGFCFEQYKFCEKVLEKVIDKESLFIFICEMDKDDDIWDYNNWAKSNPYLLFNSDNTINKDMVARLAEKAIEAKEKGGADLLNFMTKHLNYWVTNGVGGFVDLQKFKECESDLSIEDMKGKECYLGIDLSSGGDLTSISLVFPLEHEKIYIYSHSFMPELRLAEHEKTDDVPYRIWVSKGLLTLTSGAFGVKTDYKFIINHLKELIEKYEIRILEVGYDSHNASVFLQDLDFLACDLTEIKQSAKSLNDATKDFQLSVKANQLLYDKENDLLKWSIANATTTSNSFGEIKIDKQAQKYRIDPVDAVIDAWKIMLVNKNEYSANSEFDDWFEMIKGK
nr:MAG TPA: Large Terminase [Caudoviricetes sp.]